jgi:hypothetical protein
LDVLGVIKIIPRRRNGTNSPTSNQYQLYTTLDPVLWLPPEKLQHNTHSATQEFAHKFFDSLIEVAERVTSKDPAEMQTMRIWLTPIRPVDIQSGRLTIAVPNDKFEDTLRTSRFSQVVLSAAQMANPSITRFRILVNRTGLAAKFLNSY